MILQISVLVMLNYVVITCRVYFIINTPLVRTKKIKGLQFSGAYQILVRY